MVDEIDSQKGAEKYAASKAPSIKPIAAIKSLRNVCPESNNELVTARPSFDFIFFLLRYNVEMPQLFFDRSG